MKNWPRLRNMSATLKCTILPLGLCAALARKVSHKPKLAKKCLRIYILRHEAHARNTAQQEKGMMLGSTLAVFFA